MSNFTRTAKRLFGAPYSAVLGYIGALLAKTSPDWHARYARSRVRGPYRGTVADRLMAITDELGRTQDPQRAVEAARDAIRDELNHGAFDRWIDRPRVADGKVTLVKCADYLPGRSWKLQLFYIPDGYSHPPHSHTDVASCLVVAKGTLHAREYNRFHDLEDDPRNALLTLASDRLLSRGDCLLTTRSSNDVHWFGAVGGPAIAFNFQAVGFARGRRTLEYRRVYVDPTPVRAAGTHKAPKLSQADAMRRFEHLPLNAFPVQS